MTAGTVTPIASPTATAGIERPAPVDELVYRVVAARRVTPVIVELLLRPVDRPLSYWAGQYVLLGDVDNELPQRSFSIANAPRTDGQVCFLVTRVAGGELSGWVHDRLRPGDRVVLSGPYGSFVLDPRSAAALLLLAGGSGLAPVGALAEAALRRCPQRSVMLVFSARTTSDLIDEDVLRGWERRHPQFRYVRTLTRSSGPPPTGRIPTILADVMPSLDRHQVYIAGSGPLVAACSAAARALGAQPGAVFTEEFYADPHPWTA